MISLKVTQIVIVEGVGVFLKVTVSQEFPQYSYFEKIWNAFSNFHHCFSGTSLPDLKYLSFPS